MPILYFHQDDGDQLPVAGAAGPAFEEDGDWWAGAQSCFARVGLAAALAIGAQTAVAAEIYVQDELPAGSLYGQFDEDFWKNPAPPVAPAAYQRQQQWEPDELPSAGSSTAPPEDDAGALRIAWNAQAEPVAAFSDDSDLVVVAASPAPADDDAAALHYSWIAPAKPVTAFSDDSDLVVVATPGDVRSTQEATLVSVAVTTGAVRSTQEAILISVTAPVMGISYPLTPPTQLGPQEVKFRLMSVVGETASPFTGNQQEQQWPAQWWEIEITLPPMKRATSLAQRNADKRYTAELWASMLAALAGRFGTFLQGDPNGVAPQGAATGAPVTNGTSAAAPNNVITTTGWTPSITGILLAGDYIQITPTGGPQRLYKVLQDANSDGSGNATLYVAPMLHEAIGSGISIITANPQGTFRLDENKAEWDVKQARTYGISFKAKEAF